MADGPNSDLSTAQALKLWRAAERVATAASRGKEAAERAAAAAQEAADAASATAEASRAALAASTLAEATATKTATAARLVLEATGVDSALMDKESESADVLQAEAQAQYRSALARAEQRKTDDEATRGR